MSLLLCHSYGMPAKKAWNRSRSPAHSPVSSRRQADAVLHLLSGVLHQVAQQHQVQALADLAVRIAEAIQGHAAQLLFPRDRQVAGLEQERLGANVVQSNADSRSAVLTVWSGDTDATWRLNSLSTRNAGVPVSNQCASNSRLSNSSSTS